MPEEAGECVGLHRRLGVPGEADVGGAGVGAVPDQNAIATLRQGERQFPDARRVLREASAGRDRPWPAVAEELVFDREAVDLCGGHRSKLTII